MISRIYIMLNDFEDPQSVVICKYNITPMQIQIAWNQLKRPLRIANN